MTDRERKDQPNKTGAGAEATEGTDRAGKPARSHESGYGGKGAEPKTSSDQREPLEPTGKEPI